MLGEYQERFNALRKRLFDAIAIELKADDGYCKSYEGSLEWIIEYPNYFEDCLAIREPLYTLKLHCYVVGPARHYDFPGKTIKVVLDKFEMWLNAYTAEPEDDD